MSLSPYAVSKYFIVREQHASPVFEVDSDTHENIQVEGPPDDQFSWHIHAYVELSKKPNIRCPRYFDVQGFHCNIKPAKKNNRNKICCGYLSKEDKIPLTNIIFDAMYIHHALQGNMSQAILAFRHAHPKVWCTHRDRVIYNLRNMTPPTLPTTYPLTSYPQKPDLSGWDHAKQSLLLCGPPGTGKTQFLKSYLTERLKKSFLMCGHIDKLRAYQNQDAIFFDDMSFSHLPRTSQIHLLDIEEERDIHCRYSIVTLPSGTIRVFSSNESPEQVFSLRNEDHLADEALLRRLHVVVIQAPIHDPPGYNFRGSIL